MKDTYIYPAIFEYTDKGIAIEFPDLPGCTSCSHTTQEAIIDAKEALGLHLWGMETDSDIIPEPTDIRQISLSQNQAIVLIDVFMPPIRDKINNSFVKKTLSIPNWLNALAEHNNVNFSQLLQKALKEYLNVSDSIK